MVSVTPAISDLSFNSAALIWYDHEHLTVNKFCLYLLRLLHQTGRTHPSVHILLSLLIQILGFSWWYTSLWVCWLLLGLVCTPVSIVPFNLLFQERGVPEKEGFIQKECRLDHQQNVGVELKNSLLFGGWSTSDGNLIIIIKAPSVILLMIPVNSGSPQHFLPRGDKFSPLSPEGHLNRWQHFERAEGFLPSGIWMLWIQTPQEESVVVCDGYGKIGIRRWRHGAVPLFQHFCSLFFACRSSLRLDNRERRKSSEASRNSSSDWRRIKRRSWSPLLSACPSPARTTWILPGTTACPCPLLDASRAGSSLPRPVSATGRSMWQGRWWPTTQPIRRSRTLMEPSAFQIVSGVRRSTSASSRKWTHANPVPFYLASRQEATNSGPTATAPKTRASAICWNLRKRWRKRLGLQIRPAQKITEKRPRRTWRKS